jgi:hypothetical protein
LAGAHRDAIVHSRIGSADFVAAEHPSSRRLLLLGRRDHASGVRPRLLKIP